MVFYISIDIVGGFCWEIESLVTFCALLYLHISSLRWGSGFKLITLIYSFETFPFYARSSIPCFALAVYVHVWMFGIGIYSGRHWCDRGSLGSCPVIDFLSFSTILKIQIRYDNDNVTKIAWQPRYSRVRMQNNLWRTKLVKLMPCKLQIPHYAGFSFFECI